MPKRSNKVKNKAKALLLTSAKRTGVVLDKKSVEIAVDMLCCLIEKEAIPSEYLVNNILKVVSEIEK